MARLTLIFAALIFLPLLTGCEAFIHEYSYQGRLVDSNGSPPGFVEKLSVLGSEPFEYRDEHGQVRDFRDDNLAAVNTDGCFTGKFRENTYVQWLFFTPAAPPVREVFVWYFAGDRWWLMTEKVDEASQRTASGGKGVIQLGTIRLPTTTPPATQKFNEHSLAD